MPETPTDSPLHVAVIGAGSAGCAAAFAMSLHPEKFVVHVFDPAPNAGGVATSEPIPADAEYINDGVQAAAPSYRNVLRLMAEVGAKPSPLQMKVAFGKGDDYWSNYRDPTPIVERFKDEIERFEGVLKKVLNWQPIYVMVPVRRLLSWNSFSEDFMNKMVFPLTALFFGTGNQVPNVSSVIFARVFLDPDLRLFEYDKQRLVSETPTMYAFPNLREMYVKFRGLAERGGNVTFHLSSPVLRVDRTGADRGGITLVDGDGNHRVFDRLISCCDAETANRIIHDKGFWERRVLPRVRYFSDITVTHTDYEYMKKYYNIDLADKSRGDQYFIHMYPDDPSKIEMSFDLALYQPQLRRAIAKSTPDPNHPEANHVFQTIFLNAEDAQRWTINEIDPSKIVMRKWWRQFGHTSQHYVWVVGWLRLIQNTKNTFYAGSWTLVNTHEAAAISGFAAAWRLGASYPFERDDLAKLQLEMYLKEIHGVKFTPSENPRPLKDIELDELPDAPLPSRADNPGDAKETQLHRVGSSARHASPPGSARSASTSST